MIKISDKMILNAKNLILVLLTIQITSCTGQVKEKSVTDTTENQVNTQPLFLKQNTTFPQIHTNLNGMVREFVRTMHQDKKGNFWFGTNGDGIIHYNGQTLEKMINLFLEASTGLELLRTLSSDHMVSNFEEAEDGALSMHLSPQLPPGCACYQRS